MSGIQDVLAYDCISANVSRLPAGAQAVGYSTGTPDIKWTAAQRAAHPGVVLICQDAGATDATADELDIERYAATIAEAPGWSKRAYASYNAATRPGQRRPLVYVSADNVTPVVNSLIAGGVKSGVGLHVANWNFSEAQAVKAVIDASGPFPIDAFQFTSGLYYDVDVYSVEWLATVSGHVTPPAPPAPAAASFYTHAADGTKSLKTIAKNRGVPVSHLTGVAAQHLTPAEMAAMLEYLGEGNWILGTSGANAKMPKGLVYVTSTP
jgi:hypothetical protein